jgi:hypothetical protein
VDRCRKKIAAIFGDFYSKPFRAWFANKSAAYLGSVLPEDQTGVAEYFELVDLAVTDHRDEKIVWAAIMAAYNLISVGVTSEYSFEDQWTKHDTSFIACDETIDEYETLDENDLRKSVIHRFVHKLARYYSSCNIIVRELVAFRRNGHKLDIKIKTVPISKTTSTPLDENEHGDLDSFLRDRTGVVRATLDSKKLSKVADRWKTSSSKSNLVLHAEMQLVLFYATQSEFFPIQGYIGVSKKCCWSCNFVFK